MLWLVENDFNLSASARSIIVDHSETMFGSIVSIWEIVIKVNIGKLRISGSINQLIQHLREQDIEVLPISISHLSSYLDLPLHHRDPFDRMIIVQAIEKGLIVLGKDDSFDSYQVNRVW